MLDFLKSKMYFPTFKPNKWEMRERRRRKYFWSKNECGDFLLSRIQLFSCFRFCFSFHLLFLFIVHDIGAVVVLWGGMLHLTNQHFDYGESLEFFITSCTRQTKKRDHQVPTDNAVGELTIVFIGIVLRECYNFNISIIFLSNTLRSRWISIAML